MAKINFKELYEPYSEKASLEETFIWLARECRALGINENIMNEAIMAVFKEMHNGRTFSTEGAGDKGFEGIPHADINLCLKERARTLYAESVTDQIRSVERQAQARVTAQLKRAKRRAYINHLRVDSETLRLLRWVYGD